MGKPGRYVRLGIKQSLMQIPSRQVGLNGSNQPVGPTYLNFLTTTYTMSSQASQQLYEFRQDAELNVLLDLSKHELSGL